MPVVDGRIGLKSFGSFKQQYLFLPIFCSAFKNLCVRYEATVNINNYFTNKAQQWGRVGWDIEELHQSWLKISGRFYTQTILKCSSQNINQKMWLCYFINNKGDLMLLPLMLVEALLCDYSVSCEFPLANMLTNESVGVTRVVKLWKWSIL